MYVDDFIIGGKPTGQKWKKEKEKIENLYNWGKRESDSFTLCGVHYRQKQDYSVTMNQQEFTTKLSTAEHSLPKNLHRLNGKDKLDATGLTTLRGINVHYNG